MKMHKLKKITSGIFIIAVLPAVSSAMWASTPEMYIVSNVQQNGVVHGSVKDAKSGEPLIGVSIAVKGGTIGTVSDLDGNFSLNVDVGTPLIISYLGYKDKEVKATSQMSISLFEDTEQLEEVVVVGYGTQKKVNLSGSVASVNVEKMAESRPITSVSQALAGTAAGVQVTSNTNRPGSDNANILIRGKGTLNSSGPLVIIDGIEADINSVNPQDIASVSVLKDAASSAIYGSRAANGVILITTKQGQSGSFKINYNGYVSFESARIPESLRPVSNYADYMELTRWRN